MESGGFHGYRQLPAATPVLKLTEMMNMKLPAAAGRDHDGGEKINGTNNDISMNDCVNYTIIGGDDSNECTVREQDRFMPIANVIRIMRKILPPHAKISDDAKETIQECVSEYISFITGEANERCQREQRKTITAEDVLWAMSKLGFDDYIEPLTVYLHRYREMEGDHRGSMRSSAAAAAADHPSSSSSSFSLSMPCFLKRHEFRTLAFTAPPVPFHMGLGAHANAFIEAAAAAAVNINGGYYFKDNIASNEDNASTSSHPHPQAGAEAEAEAGLRNNVNGHGDDQSINES